MVFKKKERSYQKFAACRVIISSAKGLNEFFGGVSGVTEHDFIGGGEGEEDDSHGVDGTHVVPSEHVVMLSLSAMDGTHVVPSEHVVMVSLSATRDTAHAAFSDCKKGRV